MFNKERKLYLESHSGLLFLHKNNEICFIRQVDDFVIGCRDKSVAEDTIGIIDKNMTIKIKHLGIIKIFKGVDIMQTRNYIKISNATYFHKFLEDKHQPKLPPYDYPLPMNPGPFFNRKIE